MKCGIFTVQFRDVTCSVCGKSFVPAVEHIFKETRNCKLHWFCGYNCKCKFDRENPKSKGGRPKNAGKLLAEND